MSILDFCAVFIIHNQYILLYKVREYTLVPLSKLYVLLKSRFLYVYSIISSLKINYSLENIAKIITLSVIIKIIISVISYLSSFAGFDSNSTKSIIAILITGLLIVSFLKSKSKGQFVWNISVILSFWYVTGGLAHFLVDDKFSFKFLLSYREVLCFEGVIPPHLQDTLDSVFENLDDTLSDFFNGGPGGPNENPPSLFFISSNDDYSEMDKYSKKTIGAYYSKLFWSLSSKYHNMINFQNFLTKYNNSLVYDENGFATTKISEVLKSSMSQEFITWTHYYNFSTLTGDVNNYNDMVWQYNFCLWENDVLSKAKSYWEFKYMNRPLPINHFKFQYESAYNYWMNRNVDCNILGLLNNKWSIVNKAEPGMFYRELCSDTLWVKLRLIVIKSFLSHESPFIYKIAKFNSIMPQLIDSHLVIFYKAYLCEWELGKILFSKCNYNLLTRVHMGVLNHSIFPPVNTSVFNDIGLGITHKFAFPSLSEKSLPFKSAYSPDSISVLPPINISILNGIGLGNTHKFAFSTFSAKSFFTK